MMTPDQVLSFWFAPGLEERWFKKDVRFDEEVRQHLEDAHRAAATGAFDTWRDTAEGCLALCVLLDQVPRNLYRGDPRAFATDATARAALQRGFDKALTQAQRLFLYLPFEHSEDLADQELCVSLTARLDAYPDWLEYAEAHRDIIARFGRFPHRNDSLGRDSTDEERAFLKEPGSSF
jgi:uncharacterized protein (DUF924 family)